MQCKAAVFRTFDDYIEHGSKFFAAVLPTSFSCKSNQTRQSHHKQNLNAYCTHRHTPPLYQSGFVHGLLGCNFSPPLVSAAEACFSRLFRRLGREGGGRGCPLLEPRDGKQQLSFRLAECFETFNPLTS
jgi:hypothetical protein